jgi:23S rRNA pseudouridine1911/1915/1917 synthase
MEGFEFVVGGEEVGATLARALRARIPGWSWERVRRLCRGGKVLVDGTPELDGAVRLRAGQRVEVRPRAARVLPGGTPAVRIVHEDREIVVIDKPAGVSSVPFERREQGTAMDLVRAAWRQQGRLHATRTPLHVVHRIDKDTSGLLVYAKSKRAERELQAQLRSHRVDRLYLCVAHGEVTSRTLSSRLVRDRGDGLRGSSVHPAQGKRAVTHVRAVERLAAGATLCEVRLETGKTHQIRVHLAEAGNPLVGETVYIRDFLRRGGEPLPAERLLLHAATLGFAHPRDGRKVHFVAPPPDSFTAAVERLREALSRGGEARASRSR